MDKKEPIYVFESKWQALANDNNPTIIILKNKLEEYSTAAFKNTKQMLICSICTILCAAFILISRFLIFKKIHVDIPVFIAGICFGLLILGICIFIKSFKKSKEREINMIIHSPDYIVSNINDEKAYNLMTELCEGLGYQRILETVLNFWNTIMYILFLLYLLYIAGSIII